MAEMTDDNQRARRNLKILAWSIFITGILYYCLAYLLRVFPSIMEPDLLAHFHINAGAFGILSTAYYFVYAPMQLPVGVTVDKIGARRSLLFACAVATLGVLIFANTDNFTVAVIGNVLIGLGSAFAYVTTLKIATIWLPRKYFATATGVVTGSGMLAAVFTDTFLTHMVQTSGYRDTMYFALGVGIVLFILILALVRDHAPTDKNTTEEVEEKHAISFTQLGKFLTQLMKNPQMWIIGFVGALLYLPASVFTDTWGIPYLTAVYHLSPEGAGFGISIVLIGWIISSFAAGALSDIFHSRKIPLLIASLSAAIFSTIIFYIPNIPLTLLYVFLFLLGFSCGPHPLCFALSKENNSGRISGTSVAFANFLIMMGGFVFKPVVGKLLVLGWNGASANGTPIYSASDYTMALSFMPVGLFIAFFLTLMIKETYKPTVENKPETDDNIITQPSGAAITE